MTEEGMEVVLGGLLDAVGEMDEEEKIDLELATEADELKDATILALEGSNYLTRDRGLVVRLTNGEEFIITIQQVRRRA